MPAKGHTETVHRSKTSVAEEYDHVRKRKPNCHCRHTSPLEEGKLIGAKSRGAGSKSPATSVVASGQE